MELIQQIYETLETKLIEAGLVEDDLSIDQLKDGTYNFMYEDLQIGRIKFGKKSSKMQIITKDNVIWLENEPIEVYLKNIEKWINYIKEVKEMGIW